MITLKQLLSAISISGLSGPFIKNDSVRITVRPTMFLYLTYQFRLLPNNPNSSFLGKIFPDHFTNILIREMFLLVPLCSYFLLWKFLFYVTFYYVTQKYS